MLVEREPRWRGLVDRYRLWTPGWRSILWSTVWWMALMLIGLILANNTDQDPITMEAVLLLGTIIWGAAIIYFLRTRGKPDAKRSAAVLVSFVAPLLAVVIVPVTPSRPLPSIQAVMDELDDSTTYAFTDPGATYDRAYFQMMADLWEAGFLVREIEELKTLFDQNEIPLTLVENSPREGETLILYPSGGDGERLHLALHREGLCFYLKGPLDGNLYAQQRALVFDVWTAGNAVCTILTGEGR